jgi:long-chain acyl-CoA synthetase
MSPVSFKRWWKISETPFVPSPPAAPKREIDFAPADAPWLKELDRAGIPRTLRYPNTTLGRIVDQSADRFGDVAAMIYNGRTWTYRELLDQVNRAAAGLASLGVRRGDRVLMTLPNCPESVISFFAIQKLGAVVVNVGPLMGRDDLATAIKMTSPRVAIGLDLLASVLTNAAHGSTVEHFVWVSLQGYQSVLRRVGYHVKLWHARAGGNGNGKAAHHVPLNDLLAHAPSRPPTIAPNPTDTAVLQATGGTTGTLKLAELSHASILANATQVGTWMNCRVGQERVVAVLPTFHVYGLTLCLISPILSAATVILMTRFDARQAMEIVERHRPTIFPLVPAICDALCKEIERRELVTPFADIRLCFSGAAPLPKDAGERFQRVAGIPVIEGYGLTEASPVTHACLEGEPRAGSIGLPMPDTRVRVVDLDQPDRDVAPGEPGELCVAGPQVMKGYFGDHEQTERVMSTDADGTVWLHTGDIVRFDAEGYFYVLDRKKDMIIRSGLKVYPIKIEKVLRTHANVADAAVVGRDDAAHTHTVVAVVVLKEKVDEPAKLKTELRAMCREHLAPYEVPASIEFVDALPRSPLGKLLKRDLRKAPSNAGPMPAEASDAPANGKQIERAELKSNHNGKEVA